MTVNSSHVPGKDSTHSGKAGEKKSGGLFRVGLRGKMVAAMITVALVPLILFAYFIYQNTYDNLYQQSQDRIRQAAQSLAVQVSEWYQLTLRAATVTAELSEIKTMDAARVLPVLKAVNTQFPWLYNIKVHDPYGKAIARSDDAKLKGYGDRYYFQEAMKGRVGVWQTVIGRTSKKATLAFSAPIRVNNDIIGVVSAAGTIDRVKQWIADWKAGQTGYAALIEPSGKVIVHPDKEVYENQVNLAAEGHPLAVKFSNNETGELRYTRPDGVEMLGYVAATPMGWGVLVEQDIDEVLAIIRTMEKFFLIFLGGGMILAVTLGFIFSRQITRPILYLAQVAEELSLGKLGTKINVNSADEINKLAESISRLQVSMQLAMQRLKSKK